MKPKQLKSLNKKDWVCEKCSDDTHIASNCDIENNVNNLNESSEFNPRPTRGVTVTPSLRFSPGSTKMQKDYAKSF